MIDIINAIWLIVYYVLVAIAAIYAYQVYQYYLNKSRGIRGPFPVPLLGNIHLLGTDIRQFRDCLTRLLDRYATDGKFSLELGPFDRIIPVTRPEYLETILSSPFIIEKSREYDLLLPWLGDGLLLSGGKKWHSRRKVLTPAFHFGILDGFVATFNHVGDSLVEKWSNKEQLTDLRVDHDVELCALDVICETTMGVEINAQQQGETIDYVVATFELTRICHERMFGLLKRFDLPFSFTADGRLFRKYCRLIQDFTDDVIKSRRKTIMNEMRDDVNYEREYSRGSRGKMCFLDILLMSKDAAGVPFDDGSIREEVNTFMFEGHDTISSAITFTLYELSRNADVQEKVHQEIIDVCGNNATITPTNLSDLKYLEMVIKESLRLYPPVPMIARRIEQDLTLGKTFIPKNTTIGLPIFYIQRMPSLFDNPDDFIPERHANVQTVKGNAFVYIPFSAGPRNCIGQRFAMLEMKALLTKIVRNFELLPSRFAPAPQQLMNLVMKSATGVHLQLKKRTR